MSGSLKASGFVTDLCSNPGKWRVSLADGVENSFEAEFDFFLQTEGDYKALRDRLENRFNAYMASEHLSLRDKQSVVQNLLMENKLVVDSFNEANPQCDSQNHLAVRLDILKDTRRRIEFRLREILSPVQGTQFKGVIAGLAVSLITGIACPLFVLPRIKVWQPFRYEAGTLRSNLLMGAILLVAAATPVAVGTALGFSQGNRILDEKRSYQGI